MASSKDKEKPTPGTEKKGQDEEPEEECGFCIFMKGGGCKDQFTDWSKCVDEHRDKDEDFTAECRDATVALQECMVEHRDYYKDFLGDPSASSSGEKGSDGKDESSSKRKGKNDDEQKGNDSKEGGKPEKKSKEEDDKGKKPESSDGGGSGESKSSKGEDSKPDAAKNGAGNEKEDKPAKSGKDEDPGKKEGSSEEKGSKDGSGDDGGKKDGSGENSSKSEDKEEGQDGGKAVDKHEKARQDSSNKQARVVDQESHPVKAKPDHDKKEEAAKQPPKPEREDNKQDDASKAEDGGEGKSDDDGGEDEEEEEEPKPEVHVQTAPYDRRFVTTNQARHCYTRYQEYHRCAAEKGEDDPDCGFFQKAYRALCPGDWVDKWNEQREEGKFAGRF